MKINDIYESTTAGSIATVATPMSTQKRNGVGKGVYGNEPAGNLLTGKKTSKKYANSVNEGAMVDHLFKAKYKNREYGETKEVYIRAASSAEAREQAESHYAHSKSDWKCISVKQVADEGRIVRESKMKELAMDMRNMDNGNFQKKYKKSKEQLKHVLGDPDAKKTVQEAHLDEMNRFDLTTWPRQELYNKRNTHMNVKKYVDTLRDKGGKIDWDKHERKGPIKEAHLEEDDLIVIPGQGRSRKNGLIKHGESRLDHEVEMARSDLFSAAKNAKQVYELIADVSEEEGLEGWVQEKIIKANDYLNTVREYLEGKQVQEMTGGVIAGGGVGEGIVDKIKGAARREKAKDMPLVQTRRDYALGKGGEAYNKGETRKGNQYMAYAEKDRKKKGDPTTNPAGTYRTKTTDYKG